MEEKVMDILERICEDDIVREDPDMNLFEEDLLDSLGFAELLVDIEAVSYTHLRAHET